jgi:hypothetical protein
MTDLEHRLFYLEQQLARDEALIRDLQNQLRNLQNQARQSISYMEGGGGGLEYTYYAANPTSAINASPPAGPINFIQNQRVWTVNSGVDQTVTNAATIYNDTGNNVAANQQVFLGLNPDGTYSVIGQVCPSG